MADPDDEDRSEGVNRYRAMNLWLAGLKKDAGIPLRASDIVSLTDAERALDFFNELIERAHQGGVGKIITQETDGSIVRFLEGDAASFVRRRRNDYAVRYAELARQQQLDVIKSAVETKVADPQVRQELAQLVAETAQKQRELDANRRSQEEADHIREVRRIDLQARRWQMRKTMLEREPAAVLIGGLLLVVLTGTLVIGMFTHTTTPEVLINMVLLILGFFFGQTAGRDGRSVENRQ
ncbi:hypothetical protein GPX89_19730 [Nocardia sp. ET3-3]|uniref:Uncharacterized protein n=1 Tax=Nocardia terrae TaxID=2675851 RepID=A0A7K1UYK7_9NOCA|nr:hypothetical protein [Nocardia terrae]MVU79466.1 hypothetical protein [Nocardia terrae]